MSRFEEFIREDTERLAGDAKRAALTTRQAVAAGLIGTRAVRASAQLVIECYRWSPRWFKVIANALE
ncbi:hypothetical protein [Pigmentiphaga litoralis]|uniref:hypothetical protein n=1 Tax=Pigmentiphaga litoralis TaxID=516702 RepID=UPI00389B04C1